MFEGMKQKRRNKQLILAVREGNIRDIAALLDQGADIETTDAGNWDMPMLAVAVVKDRMAAMKLLLDRGAKIDNIDKDGETALIAALRWKRVEMAEELIRRGANKIHMSNKGETPAYFVTKNEMKALYAEFGVAVPVPVAPPAPVEEPATPVRADNTDEVVFYRQHGDRLLQETFNFSARERITLVRKGMDGPVEAVTRDSFEMLGDKAALRHAFEIYKSKGGNLKESDIFPDALGKSPVLPGRQP